MYTIRLTVFLTSLCAILLIALSTSAKLQAAEVNAPNNQYKTHIRTLAASCAACHGTNGNSAGITPVLAGLDANYFSKQMLAFKNGGRESTVMHHHAKGLTHDEINQLAIYFQQQKRSTIVLKPQTLEAGHE